MWLGRVGWLAAGWAVLPNKKGNPGGCAGLPLIYHTV